jgi:hypothetical protein
VPGDPIENAALDGRLIDSKRKECAPRGIDDIGRIVAWTKAYHVLTIWGFVRINCQLRRHYYRNTGFFFRQFWSKLRDV